VTTAWGSARRSAARQTRRRQRRPHPPRAQKDWKRTKPAELATVLAKLESIQREFNHAQSGGKKISLATSSCWRAALPSKRPRRKRPLHQGAFSPAHRCLAGADRRGVVRRDGARRGRLPNYLRAGATTPAEELLLDRAQLMTLTAPEIDRADRRHACPGCQRRAVEHGVLTGRPGTLTNDFFVNLLDMGTEWRPPRPKELRGTGSRLGPGQVDGNAGRPGVRLELRAAGAGRGLRLATTTGRSSSRTSSRWNKVMNLDRFDLA